MRLLVIGDVHVAAERVAFRDMWCRRALAVANHRLRRGKHFDMNLLPGIVGRMVAIEADGLIGTGDVTTTALAEEFVAVREALEPARAAVAERGGRAWIVPGNHDRYTLTATRRRRLEATMTGWAPSDGFPAAVGLTEAWRMLLLDSAGPNVWSSRGRLGGAQLEALSDALDSLQPTQGLLVVCHYPPVVPGGVAGEWPSLERVSRRLAEGRAVWEMLRGCRGRVLWLHGHVHQPWWWLPGQGEAVMQEGLSHRPMSANGPGVAFLNAGCPCRVDDRWPAGQGFWEVELESSEAGAVVRAVHHA
ncbi:MAG: metallophosphoesterase [Planctomycetota bacterium]